MRKRSLLCACVGVLALLSTGGVAQAQSGGIGGGGASAGGAGGADGTYYPYWFGARDLQLGMAGEDVMTLNWVLRGLALSTPFAGTFQSPTEGAVRSFQSAAGIATDGVVRRSTRKALSARMLKQSASYYGPGFFGNRTACGKRLTKKTVGVAHKKLPCGTRVVFAYRGRWVRAKVIDRGPYVHGRKWDLTQRLAKKLGTLSAGVAKLKVAVAP
jgi:Lytic transglycolase/Putative peptidoglycan binding domain